MSKLLKVIAWLPLVLAVVAISYPAASNAFGQVGLTELSIFRNGQHCRDQAHTAVIAGTATPIYGDDDSDTGKDSEKDDKDEDQGQIRLWDSILLG